MLASDFDGTLCQKYTPETYPATEEVLAAIRAFREDGGLFGVATGRDWYWSWRELDENGRLLVRGKTRASRILVDRLETVTDPDAWFMTGDLMVCEDGRYFAKGRADDLIVCEDGENLNPHIAEEALRVSGIEKLCIFADVDKVASLVASLPGVYGKDRLAAILAALRASLAEAKLDKVIRRIYFTNESLLGTGEFKLSRKKIAAKIRDGRLRTFDPNKLDEVSEELFEDLENDLRECFATVLDRDIATIGRDSHFFLDLEGTSIDYFALLGKIKERFGIEIVNSEALHLATVSEFSAYLKNR